MKKRKVRKEEIYFSANERRALEIPQKQKQYGPEAEALRKIIDIYPWIISIAEHDFNSNIARAFVIGMAQTIQANDFVSNVIREEEKKQK